MSRILKNLIAEEKITEFDALAIQQKYTDLFDIDDVPEAERKLEARQVADSVMAALACREPAGAAKAAPCRAGCAK